MEFGFVGKVVETRSKGGAVMPTKEQGEQRAVLIRIEGCGLYDCNLLIAVPADSVPDLDDEFEVILRRKEK